LSGYFGWIGRTPGGAVGCSALLILLAETLPDIFENLAVVEHLATRVIVMYLGRIVEEAETDSLFNNPRHPGTAARLGVPAGSLAFPA
jgi:ABC-type antimicrobial peptide transport system ATPase subunit